MVIQENKGSNSRNCRRQNFRYNRSRYNDKSIGGGKNNTRGLKQKEMKFHLHDSKAKKYSECFDKIQKHIILKIQETFQNSLDVTESLERSVKKVFTAPIKKVSTNPDPDIKALEDKNYLFEWQEDYKWYQKDICQIRDELARTYALIGRISVAERSKWH